jgi:flagellar biosynthesis/type III secretory pathway chaperone
MLSVLNDTFSKLSSVISDTTTILQDTKQALNDSKLSDSKMDWIKFAGDHKKFRSWFLAIMAQLSIAQWRELYDPDTNSVVSSTNNDTLNGKLYAKVIGSLDGPALQHMISRQTKECAGGYSCQDCRVLGYYQTSFS